MRAWRRCFFAGAAFCLGAASFSASAALPPEVRALMKKYRIAPERAGIVIKREDGEVLVSHGAEKMFNPASLIKLPLTFAAFDILGADHKWQTAFARDGEIKDGVLRGDLILSGGGDPYITPERFLFFINDLRARGLREITGDLIIDETLFALPPHDPEEFDGARYKPYNAGGGAVAVNFNAQRVAFEPQEGRIHIYTEPPNDNFIIENRVRSGKTRCRNWRGRIGERYLGGGERVTLVLRGRYSPRCGGQSFYTSALDGAANAAGIFSAVWRRMGGGWKGEWKSAPRPEGAVDIAVFESPPLAQIAAAMNKFSNNVIARNMFLSLPMGAGGEPPHTLESAREVFSGWMRGQGIGGNFYADNGSGLSRGGRMSAAQLAALMENILPHPMRAEISASLPILGIDGTLRRRLRSAAGEGRLKTGSLRGIKNIAGFIRDAAGRDVVFVCMLEKSGFRAKGFQDALIKWARAQR